MSHHCISLLQFLPISFWIVCGCKLVFFWRECRERIKVTFGNTVMAARKLVHQIKIAKNVVLVFGVAL